MTGIRTSAPDGGLGRTLAPRANRARPARHSAPSPPGRRAPSPPPFATPLRGLCRLAAPAFGRHASGQHPLGRRSPRISPKAQHS
eukprot:9131383-Pyramimonas_sp.AAC.1